MNLFNKNNKNKQFKVYAVSTKDNTNSFLTITLTRDDALEYVKKYVFLDHFEHYKGWCLLREKDINDIENQIAYMNTCIDMSDYNDYLIHSISYKYSDVVGMMRVFGKCIPIGCSFDTGFETLNFISAFNKGAFDEVENESKETKNAE